MNYVNYHRHSHFSNLSSPDSTLMPIDYINRALELGHDTVCVMEHGNHGSMTNILEMYKLANKHSLKLIIGAECYYVRDRKEKDKSNFHVVLIALNHDGLKELNKIVSQANTDGYYYKARIDDELILSLNPNNFIVTTACVAGIAKDYDIVKLFKSHFGDNFYLEVQSHNHIAQIEHNKSILQLSNDLNIELIHGNDTHYITEKDRIKRNIFLKGKGMNYGDESEFEIDYPDYETIVKRYKKQGVLNDSQITNAINNTLVISEKTSEFTFNNDIKMPSLFPNLSHDEKMDKLTDIARQEYARQYRGKIKDKKEFERYGKEIKYELDIIRKTEMEDYFLLNYYVIKKAKENGGILTRTGRGSGVSFLVNKLFGFTEIDRLQENVHLYPTRFMSVSRILETRSLPDKFCLFMK